MKYTCYTLVVLCLVPLLHNLEIWNAFEYLQGLMCTDEAQCGTIVKSQDRFKGFRIGLCEAKKKKAAKKKQKSSTVKDDTKDDLKETDQEEASDSIFQDDEDSTIVELQDPLQVQAFMKRDKLSLLYVYHEDDDSSVELLDEFKKTEQKLRGYANFIVIGCHKEGFSDGRMPACSQELNRGVYPLLSGMVPPLRRINPYTKKHEDNTEIPYGNRAKNHKAMIKFVQAQLPNFTEHIKKGQDYDDKIVNGNEINKVVLFSDKMDGSKGPPALYKALATNFKEKLEFYTVDIDKLKKRVKSLKITEYPTILVYAKYDKEGEELDNDNNNLANLLSSSSNQNYTLYEDRKIVRYTGDVDMVQLIEFLQSVALNENYNPSGQSKSNEQRKSKYTIVNYKNYTKGVLDDYRTQIIFFDERFDGIKDKFDHVAEELHGPTNVVFFDCAKKETAKIAEQEFKVSKFPRILVYATGVEKDPDNALEVSPSVDADDLVNLVMETEIKDNLRDVSDSLISSVLLTNALQLRRVTLVYLYEGDTDEDVPLAYKALSMHPELKEHFDFVAIKNPSQPILQQFQVRKMPIVIGGLPPPEGMDSASPEAANSIQTMVYQGDVNDYYELLSYNLGVVNMFYPKKESTKQQESKPVETVAFQEITASNVNEICESKKGLCVIAFLDGNLHDANAIDEFNDRLSILERRNKESSSQFKYMWINSTCHDYSLLHFDLSPMALPTLVIYSPRQQKYSKMVSSFSEENIIDFEKSFEGTGKARVSIYDSPVPFADIVRDIDCPNLTLDSDLEDGLDVSEEEDEILRELMEEEKQKQKEKEEELGLKSSKKKKKKKSKK